MINRRFARTRRLAHAMSFLLLLLGGGARAADGEDSDSLPNLAGVTGLLNVPTASTLPEGAIAAGLVRYTDPAVSDDSWHMQRYYADIGLFEGLEVSGQYNLADRLGTSQWSLRDLSFGAKLRVPGIPASWPQLAIGADDFGGSVPFFRSRYALASYRLGPLSLTAGYGNGPERLDGVFGGVGLRLPWGFSTSAEYDTEHVQGGLRWASPVWRDALQVHGGVLYTDRSDASRWSTHFGVLVYLPGSRPPPSVSHRDVAPPVAAAMPPPAPAPVLAPVPAAPVPAPDAADLNRQAAARLQAALRRAGFSRVSVRASGADLQADIENSVFRNNEVDALGVALGLMAREAGCAATRLTLVLRRDGVPLGTFGSRAVDFRRFLNAKDCSQRLPYDQLPWPVLTVDLYRAVESQATPADAAYVSGGRRAVDLLVYPRYAYFLGTEVTSFGYSAALAGDLRLPLWRGATANVVGFTSPIEDKTFDDGGVFDPYGLQGGLQSAMLYQAFVPHAQGIALVGAGRIARHFDGGVAEWRWMPDEEFGTLSLRAAYGRDHADRETRSLAVGTYDLQLPDWRTGLRVSYGRYLHDDYGPSAELYRDFGDVRVSLFVQHTAQDFVGLRIRLPLSPRRAGSWGRLTLRGNEAWNNQIRTTINVEGGNPLFPDLVSEPRGDFALEKVYANNGRWSQAYVLSQLPRLREADRRWNGEVAQ